MLRLCLTPKIFLVLLIATGSAHHAMADDDHGGSWWGGKPSRGDQADATAAAPAQYLKECASCHIAYPAGLLPAGSWQHLMTNLNQHYGNDASLDASSTNTIAQYLTSHAGTYKRVNEMPPQDRITQSAWFSRKHDGHVSASVWKRPSIGSRSNCVACHSGAEQSNFNEHSVRIPG
jgi:mono/diheme cytochrome c family protein